jgi:beta-lysine 5,6-aminomutase beta subunit
VTEPTIIRPYGDTTGDGMVQLSFTLPVPCDKRAEGAALQLAAKMGLAPAMVVHARQIGAGHTFLVVYGSVHHLVELDQVRVLERDFPLLGAKEINAAVRQRLRRKLAVVGACNVKGIAGEKGLEYYRELKVTNLGAQVTVAELVRAARDERADAVLVSQVVTQRDAHLRNTREMSTAFREAFGPQRPLLVVGGPRFDELMSAELGVDRVFGRGTTPREVASYLVHALAGQIGTGEPSE